MIFREDMIYPEALDAFYRATDGKSEAEIDRIQREFKEVVAVIVDREIDDSNILTSYQIKEDA